MRKTLLAITLAALLAAVPAFAVGPPGSGSGSGVQVAADCDVAAYYPIGTLCQDSGDGKLYKGTGAAVVELAAGASGDFLADGTVPMTGAIIPDSAGGQTIGTTSAEFGHIYLHNSKSIYFQADQSVYLTGGAGALSLTGGNFTPGASTLTLGSTAAEWGGLYLGDGKIIYGQADQSNTITSSATGWVFNLPITTQSAKLTGGTNTFNLTNGTASLDVAAGATLNIDTSLAVNTAAVTLVGKSGGSSLTLPTAISLDGTMADGRLCTYASSGTVISCNTATSTYQTADADLTTFAGLTATRGDILYVGEAGTWADLAKGSANTVLYSDGTDVKYGTVTSAMITDNTITATDLAATLTFADGDFIDLSGITMSGTNDEGITLPFWADVTPTSGATKRFITWDESGGVLKIYTSGGWTTINPSAGAPTDVAYLVTGSLSGSLSAERLLAEGTGIDFTDAGANGNFTIAVDTTEIGTTTWGSGSEVVWTFNASGGTDPTLTFGNASATFAGTFSATAFSGNLTGNVTGNCSGSAGTVTDAELAAIQGLTFADASIIQLTGAAAAAVLTSGGNNYVLKSTSDNSALEFAAPTGTGAPVLGTAPSFTTSITPNSAGASTIGTTSLEWGNVYLTDSAVIYGQADQSATLTSSASTWTASAFTVTGTLTANGNTVVGNADTDTLTLRSLLVGGNSRAVWIAGSAPTPTYATGTNELYVAGDIESGGNVYAANFVGTGTGESYIGMANNASRSPTASAYEIYFEGASDLKFNVNGAEKTTARLEDAQTFSGAKTFTGGLYAGDASNAASVRLYDGSSNYWTIAVPAMSGNYTLTLPADDGTTGQYLKTDGSGALSWDTPTAAAAGSDTQVQFNDGGSALGGDAGFVFAKTTGTLTLGKNTVGGELVLYNELGATDYNATIAPNATQAADITITLPAATSTLATLGANTFTGTQALGTNNLTMTGSLAATGARVTKGWFTDIESTNMPTVGGTAILSSLTAPQFTTIELGHASDSTISRVSAGVLAIEGSNILTAGASPTLTGAWDFGGATSVEIPNGTGPTVDAAGEIAIDTTSDQLVYYGGAKRVLPYKQYASFVIPAPAATDDINLLKAPYGMTISAINCIVQGTTSVTGQLQECSSTGGDCADLDSDITCDADGAADDGSLTDSAIAANGWLRWKTTSVSGTPTFLTVTVTYSVVSD